MECVQLLGYLPKYETTGLSHPSLERQCVELNQSQSS